MSDQPPDSSTFFDFLAVWGAVVATIALAWNIIRDWRDKPKLKVSAALGMLVSQGYPFECLSVSATNVGRRPLTVDGLYGELESKRRMFILTNGCQRSTKVPHKLDVGESMKLIMDIDNKFLTDLANMTSLCVEDSSGGKWFPPQSQIEAIKTSAVSLTT